MRLLGFTITRAPTSVAVQKVGVSEDMPAVQKSAITPLSYREVWGMVRESFAGAWQRNIVVDNRESILAFSAVYSCVTRIAGDIAKLAIRLVELQADGTWQPAVDTSPYWAVLRKPNRFQNRIQFLTDWLVMKLLYGNAYVLKERDGRGLVSAMYVLDSRRVKPLVTADGAVYYQISSDQLAGLPNGMPAAPAADIIHDRAVTLWHPLCGVSPLYACARSATQGNRIQNNSAVFFENMSRPSGVLTAPAHIADDTALRLKTDWEQNFAGSSMGRLAVLGDGLKYEPMTIPAEDAQLIEQLKWTVEDVARAFGVPLYKINGGPVPTSNNVEALEQQYYTGCLQVLIEAIELCLDEGLSLPVRYGTQLDLDGLLRMDSATQIEVLSKAVGGAIMAPNEAREKLNLPPIAGGKSVYLQQQNYSLEALAKRDAQDDPFGNTAAPAAPPPTNTVPPPPPPDDAAAKAIEQLQGAAGETLRVLEEAQRSAKEHGQRIDRLADAVAQASTERIGEVEVARTHAQAAADAAVAAAQAATAAAENQAAIQREVREFMESVRTAMPAKPAEAAGNEFDAELLLRTVLGGLEHGELSA